MKHLTHAILALAALMTLSACEIERAQEPLKFDGWQESKVTSRQVDGQEIPTSYIFDCRKMTEAQNTHYYYSLIADPKGTDNRNDKGEKETTYNNAQFNIEYYSTTPTQSNSLTKGLLAVDVDFKVVEVSQGDSEAIVIANEATVATFKQYYKNNPYFNHVQAGDELLRLRSNPYQSRSTNVTVVDLPGITNGDQLECR